MDGRHAWICEKPGDVGQVRWTRLGPLAPDRDQVVVDVKAASLNFPDILMIQGKYQSRPSLPFVTGSEFAGIVDTVGDDVDSLRPGQRVACWHPGAFATQAVVPASSCVPLVEQFDFIDAAAFFTIYATSWHALIDRAALKAGETVLVLGAAGGVGTSAIQIAKAAGARVIAAASSEEKCALCRRIGADETIDYSEKTPHCGFRAAVKSATDGKGPDVIYDPVGGAFSEVAFRTIAWRGRHLIVGFAAGSIPTLPLNLALLKGASVIGVFRSELARIEPMTNRRMLADLQRWYSLGRIKPVIDSVSPMTELKAACERMLSRDVLGKIVLVT